jgi:4-hydroxybenzoate polyprenyltransferase
MAAKKAASQKSQSFGNDMLWKWVYGVGLVVAGVVGALALQIDILTWILLLVAVLLGLFYFVDEEIEHFGLRFIILVAAQAALSAVPAVGQYITGFFGGLVMFIGPIVLTMAFMWILRRRILPLFQM